MKTMQIKLIGNKKTLVVRIDGELDHHIASKLKDAIDEKIRRTNAVNVIFDFSDSGFMDSSGIGVIMGRYKAVKTLGGNVILTGLDAQLKKIIKMSGIDKVVKVSKTTEQALKSI